MAKPKKAAKPQKPAPSPKSTKGKAPVRPKGGPAAKSGKKAAAKPKKPLKAKKRRPPEQDVVGRQKGIISAPQEFLDGKEVNLPLLIRTLALHADLVDRLLAPIDQDDLLKNSFHQALEDYEDSGYQEIPAPDACDASETRVLTGVFEGEKLTWEVPVVDGLVPRGLIISVVTQAVFGTKLGKSILGRGVWRQGRGRR